MSTKASLYYDEKTNVHLYREMIDNEVYLETDTLRVLLPESLGRLLIHIDFDELEWKVNNGAK